MGLLFLKMDINVSKLRGKHVYLESLAPAHKELIRTLARDERIWEFNRMLLVNDSYDKQFDSYQ